MILGGEGISNRRNGVASDYLSNIALWLDASDSSTLFFDGLEITRWNDKSGNGYDALPVSDTERPSYSATGFNGKPTISFDGIDNILTTTLEQLTTATIYIVLESVTKGVNVDSVVLGASTSFNSGGLYYIVQGFSTGEAGLTAFYTSPIPETDCFFNGTVLPTNISFGENLYVHYADGVTTNNLNYSIGGNLNSNSSAHFLGNISEIIISSEIDSIKTRQLVEGSLVHKWGINAKLDATHPYRSNRPINKDGVNFENKTVYLPRQRYLEDGIVNRLVESSGLRITEGFS